MKPVKSLGPLYSGDFEILTLKMSKNTSVGLVEDAESSKSSSLKKEKPTSAVEEITIPDVSKNDANVIPKDLATAKAGAPESSEVKRLEGMPLFLLTTGMMMSMFIMSLDKAIIGKFAFVLWVFLTGQDFHSSHCNQQLQFQKYPQNFIALIR